MAGRVVEAVWLVFVLGVVALAVVTELQDQREERARRRWTR